MTSSGVTMLKIAETLLWCERVAAGESDDNNPLLTKQLLLQQMISELGTEELRIRNKTKRSVAAKILNAMPSCPDVSRLPPSFVLQEARLQLLGAAKSDRGISEQLFAATRARSMLEQLLDASGHAQLLDAITSKQPASVHNAEVMSEATFSSRTDATESTFCPTQTHVETGWHTEAIGSIAEPVEPVHVHPNLLLLAFTRHSKHFHAAVSKTALAQRFLRQYVNVSPAWAHGAKILVDGLLSGDAAEFRAVFAQQPRLGPNHVVLQERDETGFMVDFIRCMNRLHQRNRVTVKPHGGRLVLSNYSLDVPSAAARHELGEPGQGLPMLDISSLQTFPEDDLHDLLPIPEDAPSGYGQIVSAPGTSAPVKISEAPETNLPLASLPAYLVKEDDFQRLVPFDDLDNESSGSSAAYGSAPF